MDSQNIKEYILENNCIPTILEAIGCHHISHKSGYYTAANPDGDNVGAINVYESDLLNVVDYTRDIDNSNKRYTDIFDLVEYFKDYNFFEAVKFICDCISLDYYADPYSDLPESLKVTRLIMELEQDDSTNEEDKPIKPIPERILSYYLPFVNDFFREDNIPYAIQKEFEVGYDDFTNRITIPIRDEYGTLVGVKGRLFQKELSEEEKKVKYIYVEPCNRSKILYGLNKSLNYIINQKKVYVVESEKGVMQLWAMGICNCVATCGKKVSANQIEKLTRLGVDIIFLFDKDVEREEIQALSNRFLDVTKIYAVIDKDNILDEKESPTDNPAKFSQLREHYMERIK